MFNTKMRVSMSRYCNGNSGAHFQGGGQLDLTSWMTPFRSGGLLLSLTGASTPLHQGAILTPGGVGALSIRPSQLEHSSSPECQPHTWWLSLPGPV